MNSIDPSELEIKETIERKISDILEAAIFLERGLVTKDTDLISNNEMDCVCYLFSKDSVRSYPWLANIFVWIIPTAKEVAFITAEGSIPLPSMTAEERSWIEDSTVTIEFDRLKDEDLQYIVESYKDVDPYKEDLVEVLLKMAKDTADFAKIIPLEFPYNDSTLVIFNVFVRNQLLGFVDVFINKDGLTYYAVRTDLSDRFNPQMKKKEYQNIKSSIKFIVGTE